MTAKFTFEKKVARSGVAEKRRADRRRRRRPAVRVLEVVLRMRKRATRMSDKLPTLPIQIHC
jgi:hypothetical protein